MRNKEKIEAILDSYVNGNVSWVKSEVKKLSKQVRKELYMYSLSYASITKEDSLFFFGLI